jgi:hypothetical protein
VKNSKTKKTSKNNLVDLNEYLFMTLESLTNEDLSSDDLDKEIKRAKAVVSTSNSIINIAALSLDAQKHVDEYYGLKPREELPEILKIGNTE